MKFTTIALIGFLVSSVAFAESDDHIRSAKNPQIPLPSSDVPSWLTPGTYQQAIDHFGQESGKTFSQRYWYDSQYANSDEAPVLYHICGESDATHDYFLNDNAVAWAQALGAHLVYLEHRYYGQSLPFSDLSDDHIQYLTLGNAIEDLAEFQKWVAAHQGWKGKWISIGGSYSGTLSAIYRQKHPELVVGALAASAPMISGVGVYYDGTASDIDQLSSTDPSGDTGARQWTYQSCTQFGFWQAEGATPGSPLLLPSSKLCGQVFGKAPYFDVGTYNQRYDAPFISSAPSAPSNILFTYGSEDIWTTIGLSQQKNSNPNITIWMIDGAGHHYDLNPASSGDSSAVIAARAEFMILAKKWLGN